MVVIVAEEKWLTGDLAGARVILGEVNPMTLKHKR